MEVPDTTHPPEITPELAENFCQIKRYHEQARAHATQAVGLMVLAGIELKRIHKLLEPSPGRPNKLCQRGTISWDDCLTHYVGITRRTAYRYMELASACGRRNEVLDSAELLEIPLADMPEARQAEIRDAVAKVTNGQTATQILMDFGLVKANPIDNLSGGHKGGPRQLTPEQERVEIARRYSTMLLALEKRGVEFTQLQDEDLELQCTVLEMHLQARRRWIATARHARKQDELIRWWHEQVRKLDAANPTPSL